MKALPHRHELMKPVLDAMVALGGSASVEELRDKIILDLQISDALANQPHISKRGSRDGRTQLEYELAWVRTELKQLGWLTNSSRGVWATTSKLSEAATTELKFRPLSASAAEAEDSGGIDGWRDKLNATLSAISPDGFERLIQRLLRETGFTQVEVTGRTGDGGIDGRGVVKINGILSFHIVFQCKRHKNPVPAAAIRDFRGAMSGRTDKGLFITTGSFTRDSIKEARRDGAAAIDLIDGETLAEKLKSLQLGIRVEQVEQISVDTAWFSAI